MKSKTNYLIPSENYPLTKMQYILLFFLIYSLLGWIMETGYAIYELGHFVKRGFLFGPICPIYGYGAIILILFLSKYKNNSFKLFFLSAIIFSLFEYLVSFGLDAMFADKWWDYSNEFFNLNGRISLMFSFVWGIIAILFINHIHPFIHKKITNILKKVPYNLFKVLLYLSFITFLADTFCSSIKNII